MKLINLVKRISFAALGLSAMFLASCKPEDEIVEATIAVSPTGIELNYFEQQTEIEVTSSEDWTLEGDYSWVTPSTVSGKNGDVVVFSVNANTTGKTRTASFTFKVTGAETKAVIKQTAGEVEMNLGLTAVSSGDEDVTLALDVESKDIAFFNKWGIRYSLTDVKTDGTDFEIDGVPAEGVKEVKVTGLETNKRYYFWGYVEDISGNRYYTDRPVEKSTGNLLDIPVTFSAGAFSLYAEMAYDHADAVELGICWSETEEPGVEDNVAKIDNPESGEILISSIISGKRLAAETKYYVRVYTKDAAGKVLYTPAEEVTTLANPIQNWVNTDTRAENKFNSLCEYGPSWDGESDYSQYVVDNGSDIQLEFRNIWNEAFLSYTDYHYSYSNLMFREIGGKMYMYHQIYREGSVNEGMAKEANFIGGLVYEMEFDADGNMKFTFAGLQHMSTNNWVCDRQDVVKNEMYHLYNTKATNKDAILKIQKFYEDHTFFVDYGPATEYNDAPYRELRFYAADDLSLAFNYNQRIIGFKNYDFKTYATDDPGEGSGETGGGDISDESSVPAPDSYADMRQNSVAITWADNNSVNGLSAITMETLFRWDGFNPDEGIDTMFGIEGSWIVRSFNNFHWIPADGWFVGAPGGEFCFAPFQRDGEKNVTNWGGMTQDVWHHLALTYDSSNGSVVVYIDGQVVSSGTYPLGPVNLYNSGLTDPTFYLGKSYNDTRWFNGDLSEVRIWSRALSAEEINAEGHFYSVDPASADRLLAYWKLGNGQGTHVEDYSGNGNHGTAAKDMVYGEGSLTPDPALPKDSEGNYLLASAADWEVFAEIVKENRNANAKFTADIDLGDSQTMIANYDNLTENAGLSYNGTIDGDGHTLTIAYTVNYSVSEPTMAPIYFAGNATVKNLHVTGTILSDNDRSNGFIGVIDCNSSATIENCISSVKITYEGSYHWTYAGGFVGRVNSGASIIFKDCLYNGSLVCSNGSNGWGPFVGWAQGGAGVTLENCLCDPETINVNDFGDTNTFCNTNDGQTLTNCWYTQTVGNAQGNDGTALSAEELASKLNAGRAGAPWIVKDGKATLSMDTTPGGSVTPDPDPEPTDGIEAPSAYSDMRHNSIAITWSDTDAVNNLSAITMETLFKWDAFNPDEGIDTMFGVEGAWLVRCMNNFHWIPEDGWFVCTPYGGLCFAPFERDGAKNVTDWKGMTQDVWHHLAVTYDSNAGSVAVYIDGKTVASGSYQFGPVNLYDASLTDPVFHIGKSYNDTRWFNGDMAEVRIWNRALSADEINAKGHFYGVDATSDGLLAYWKLNGTGTHVEDYSGNGHHGTAANAF